MGSLNKVLLMGNLTKDPELRYTPKGTAVANIRVAASRKFRDRSGEWREETCFVNVVAWDKQAEYSTGHLKKGCKVFIEGILQSRSWDSPDGQKRSVVEVRAELIQDLSVEGAQKAADEAAPAAENIVWEE
ncbi:MAG: single-stranded DNA-binding protein [Candidatus Omnitrophota bacterium]